MKTSTLTNKPKILHMISPKLILGKWNQNWICNVTDEPKHFALQLYFMHCRPKCCTAFLGGPWFNYYICPSLVIWTTMARISYFSPKSMRKFLINKKSSNSDLFNFYSNTRGCFPNLRICYTVCCGRIWIKSQKSQKSEKSHFFKFKE